MQVLLGDAIVCWRACVVWQNNRAVLAACGVCLVATFCECCLTLLHSTWKPSDVLVKALGIIDTTLSCNMGLHWSQMHSNIPISGAMYKGFSVGLAACILSFSTNLLATLLVGWKAWCVFPSST